MHFNSILMARFLKQSFAQACLKETDNGKLHQFNYRNESTLRTWAGKRVMRRRSLKADCTDFNCIASISYPRTQLINGYFQANQTYCSHLGHFSLLFLLFPIMLLVRQLSCLLFSSFNTQFCCIDLCM